MITFLLSFSLFFSFIAPFQFEDMSGKNDLLIWENVKTNEDFENLDFFKKNYQKSLQEKNLNESIPQLIHFVWLSEEKPSKKIMDNLKSWHQFHPGWTIKCWTYGSSFAAPFPITWAKAELLRPISANLKRAEEAEFLRYEILAQEGGIVIDPSLKCLQSFESLAHDFNFFTGMNLPEETVLSSSIFPSRSIIGALKGHPVIEETLRLLTADWEKTDLYFPVNDDKSLKYRLNFRFTNAFQQAIKTKLNEPGFKDIVLPPAFFLPLKTIKPLAKKTGTSIVFSDKSPQEIEEEKFIDQMKKDINRLLVFDLILCLINLSLAFMVFYFFKCRKSVVAFGKKSYIV